VRLGVAFRFFKKATIKKAIIYSRVKGLDMKYRNHVMIFAIMVAASFMVSAEEVYQSKDKQGNVEFSDQSSPGAKVIEVKKPTIVHLEPGKPAEQDPAPKAAKKPTAPDQPEVVYGGDNYDDDENRNRLGREEQERERKDERQEHREGQSNTGQQAVHKEGVKRGAVHHGGGRR